MVSADTKIAIIPLNGSVSNSIDLEGYELGAFNMPTDWTTANITILASDTRDGTYKPVYRSGLEVTEIVEAGHINPICNPLAIAPLRYIKLRSGTSATPVVQTAERVIILILKDE